MKISEIVAISLGVVHHDGGITKDGKSYEAYSKLGYVVVNESSSRTFYIPRDNAELQNQIMSVCSVWGNEFVFDGEMDSHGRITIQSVSSEV